MSLFKKKDEDRKEAYKPSDDNVSAKEGASGGKGGGEPAAPSVDPSTKSGKAAIKKSMDDGRFGYGYIDRNTGVEVPWYIDMINGGGANAAGDTFVSPFADLPFGGGLTSMPTNLANAAGIAPYGYNQPRRYAQAGMQGYPTAAAPAPTGGGVGGGSSTVTPTTPVNPYAVGGGFDVTAPPAQTNPYSVGGGFDVTAPPQVTNPYAVGGGFNKTAPKQYPTDDVNILEMGGTNLLNTQVLGTGRTVNTYGEQALREKAIQLYGQAFNDLTPSSQRLIIQGLMQGMVNAN